MKELEAVVESLKSDFPGSGKSLLWQHRERGGSEEGYRASFEAGVASIVGDSPLGVAYGVSQLVAGLESGTLSRCLGTVKPRAAHRVLWLEGYHTLKINEHASLALPRGLTQDLMQAPDKMLSFCKGVLELGYNTLVLGLFPQQESAKRTATEIDLNPLLHGLRAHGLKIWLAFSLTAKEPHLLQELCTIIDEIDGLVWMGSVPSRYLEDGRWRAQTAQETISEEISQVRRAMLPALSLLYLLPWEASSHSHQEHWIHELLDGAPEKVIVAASSVIGDPCEDDLPRHPLWKVIASSHTRSCTPFLPMVNIGQVKRGGGLWPTLPLQMMQYFLTLPHTGAICMASALPSRGVLLHCNLWVAAQLLWKEESAERLAEIWFRAYCPEMEGETMLPLLVECHQIVQMIDALRRGAKDRQFRKYPAEVVRSHMESLLARLQVLATEWMKPEPAAVLSRPQFSDYLRFYLRDAKRLLLLASQEWQIALKSPLHGADMLDSFWTELGQQPGKSLNSSVGVRIRNEPHSGTVGSMMEKIYRLTLG